MRKLTCFAALLALQLSALAEPEIKGTPTELNNYLHPDTKTVAITGEAEVRVPAHRAVLTLKVTTENRSLQQALSANLEIRRKIADHLKSQGIAADRVKGSRFSSTPKFGMFGDKAKSYRVENSVRVSVDDEKEFQSAAACVETLPEVQFGGVEFEYADKEALKTEALSQACDHANERRKILEEKLGLKLTPIQFTGGDVTRGEENRFHNMNVENLVSAGKSLSEYQAKPAAAAEESDEESASSFGEMIYTARITIACKAEPK